MANRIQLRRGLAAAWASANTRLAEGEAGFESDTGKLKIGNGTSDWNDLPYFGGDPVAIPTKVSELENDTGFITSAALPTNLSELNNDIGFITSEALPNTILDLGIVDGTLGQVLTANGDGTFSFTTVTGVSNTIDGLDDVLISEPAENQVLKFNGTQWVNGTAAGEFAISTTQETILALAPSASIDVNLAGAKAYVLYKIETSHAAWVRVYINDSSRVADSSREQGADPGVNSGVIAEAITAGAETVAYAPAVNGFNNESPATSVIPITVTNLSGETADITVTITLLALVA